MIEDIEYTWLPGQPTLVQFSAEREFWTGEGRPSKIFPKQQRGFSKPGRVNDNTARAAEQQGGSPKPCTANELTEDSTD